MGTRSLKSRIRNWNHGVWGGFDFAFWKLFFHINHNEYDDFEFYKLNFRGRKEYISEYNCMVSFPLKYNEKDQWHIFENKNEFNIAFSDFVGRDWCFPAKCEKHAFYDFVKSHPEIICKPANRMCGAGIYKVKTKEINDLEVFFETAKNDRTLIEEVIKQHKLLEELNPDTLNTIRALTTINSKGEINIPYSIIRIGRKGKDVDNFNAGGMEALIDTNTGVVCTKAIDGVGNQFVYHPDTGVQICGFLIPKWEQIKETIIEAALRYPTMRLIGWDISVREDGEVCLVEGNHNADSFQLIAGKGLRKEYERLLK